MDISLTSKLIIPMMAAGIAEFLTLPVCTIKTNYQNTTGVTVVQTIRSIYKCYGIKSFYQASLPAISSQIFSSSSKYFLYKYFEEINKSKYSNKILNGMMSGIIISFFTQPIDFVKIYWQMNKPIIPEIKKMGLLLLYRGYSKTFLKSAVGTSLYYPLYDYFDKICDNVLISSITTGIIAAVIVHPFDYLKTRHVYGLPWFQGWNILHYYKGLPINMMRTVPNFIILMTLIKYLNLFMNSN